jgi:hypothetical protein
VEATELRETLSRVDASYQRSARTAIHLTTILASVRSVSAQFLARMCRHPHAPTTLCDHFAFHQSFQASCSVNDLHVLNHPSITSQPISALLLPRFIPTIKLWLQACSTTTPPFHPRRAPLSAHVHAQIRYWSAMLLLPLCLLHSFLFLCLYQRVFQCH